MADSFRHAVMLAKPGGSISHWAMSSSLVGEGGSDQVVDTLSSLDGGFGQPFPQTPAMKP